MKFNRKTTVSSDTIKETEIIAEEENKKMSDLQEKYNSNSGYFYKF